MHAALLDDARLYKQFDEIYRSEAIHTLPLVTYTEPRAETYNLLQHNVSKHTYYYLHDHDKTNISDVSDNSKLKIFKNSFSLATLACNSFGAAGSWASTIM